MVDALNVTLPPDSEFHPGGLTTSQTKPVHHPSCIYALRPQNLVLVHLGGCSVLYLHIFEGGEGGLGV